MKDVIAHLFDVHVEGKRDWNLAQLVAWVETVQRAEIVPPHTPVRMTPWKSIGTTSAFLPPSEIEAITEEIRQWQALGASLALRKKMRDADQKCLATVLSSTTQGQYFNYAALIGEATASRT